MIVNITVPVDDARIDDFYQFFWHWRMGAIDLPDVVVENQPVLSSPTIRSWSNAVDDLTDAISLWRRYTPQAREIFSFLMDNAEQKFTGEEIAVAVNIPNGAKGVAGQMGWPGRYGRAIGRGLPSEWEWSGETGVYWMTAAASELFKSARASMEAVE